MSDGGPPNGLKASVRRIQGRIITNSIVAIIDGSCGFNHINVIEQRTEQNNIKKLSPLFKQNIQILMEN
jgi:hypothetical protein